MIQKLTSAAGLALLIFGSVGCAMYRQERQPYETRRDKTAKGAG